MSTSELTFDEIYDFIIANGGSVTNTDIIRQFRHYLLDPLTKDDAKAKLKLYVNELASTRNDGSQKILTLRSRYQNVEERRKSSANYDNSLNSIGIPSSPMRAPPPYRPPPPVQASPSSNSNSSITSSTFSLNESGGTPQAPPRRRSSSDRVSGKENEHPPSSDAAQTISVKERTQKFNRLASIEDEGSSSSSPKSQKGKKKATAKGGDDDDGASVTSLEPKKCAAWHVAAAKGDYQELAKLATKEPRLIRLKDPYTTVLHWGAKHGNADVIKLFAGTYGADVNAKTNGGYTPLHLAAHFGRDDVYKLLIQVYKADENIRDYRGKKASQYVVNNEQGRGKATIKNKSRKNKYGDKFLRVGSLNVRVKKTTEAFSSFLGVGGGGGGGAGGGSLSSIEPIAEKVHKGWGSADNVTQDGEMPAPKACVKRKAKLKVESRTLSNPSTPNQPQKFMQRSSLQDSDSDTAAGFDSAWQIV